MIFLKLLEYSLFGLIFIVVITQIVWPLMKNRPTFPIFRKRAKLETALAVALEAKDEVELQKKIEALQQEATPVEVQKTEVK